MATSQMEATSFVVAEKKKKKKTVTDGDVRDAKAAKKQRKEEYEGYVINAQLRRMIARSLPARDVQRKP